MLKLKYLFLGLFLSTILNAENIPLTFVSLDPSESNSKKILEILKRTDGRKSDFLKYKSFYKINENLYLYDYCNAPRFSGINLINIKKGTNEQIALSECSLASTNLIMFNIDSFSKEFRLLTSYQEGTYFRVGETKCDFQGKCVGKNLLIYRIPKPKVSLCKNSEKSVFSCATGEKLISLCSIQPSGEAKSNLTYRFGKPNATPELEYISKGSNINKYFKYAKAYYGNGSIQELSFKKGSYLYTIYQGRHNYRNNSAGLLLEKNGKKIANFSCNNTPTSDWNILLNFKFNDNEARDFIE